MQKVGDRVVVNVTPGQPIDVELNGIARVSGTAAAVAGAESITITPVAVNPLEDARGIAVAGTGIQVEVAGSLAAPLDVAFAVAAPADMSWVPVSLHVADSGAVDAVPAKYGSGTLSVSTKSFSLQIPGWITDLADFLVDDFTGRTDPPPCPPNGQPAAPAWATLTPVKTGSVHQCLFNNTDSAGRVRSEIFIKSNRGTYQVVRFPGGFDYQWADPSTRAITAAARKTRAIEAGEWLLPAGAQASAGYVRPGADWNGDGYAKGTPSSVLLSVAAGVLGEVGGLVALGKCGVDPATFSFTVPSVSNLYKCGLGLFGDMGLDDEANAARFVTDLYGVTDKGLVQPQIDQLVAKAKKANLIGKILATLNMAAVAAKVLTHVGDAIAEGFAGGGAMTLYLDAARSAPPAPAPPAPAPTPTVVRPPAPTQAPTPAPPTPAPVPSAVLAYDNYAPGGAGRAMCRGNPGNSASMPGGTASQTFTVPSGVGRLSSALVQIDPDSRVTAHLTLAVDGAARAYADAAASGRTAFTFADVAVRAGQTVTLSIRFTATYGKIITVYTGGSVNGTFTAVNSCPDGAPNVTLTGTGLLAQVAGSSA